MGDELGELADQFGVWRKQKLSLDERIPDHLMNQATSLVGEYRLSEVSKALHLDYVRLKAVHGASNPHYAELEKVLQLHRGGYNKLVVNVPPDIAEEVQKVVVQLSRGDNPPVTKNRVVQRCIELGWPLLKEKLQAIDEAKPTK